MPQNLLISLLPFIALILAGLSVAALWYWWISTKDDEPEESAGQPIGEPASRAELSAEPPAAKPVLTSVSAPPASAAQPVFEGEAIEVMRILRDLADGSLIVEIDGRRYRSLNEIVDPQVGRRFMGNAQALADFAKLGKIRVPEEWAQVPTPERPAASAPQPPAHPAAPPPPPPPPEPAAPRRGGLFRRAQAEDEQPVEQPPIAEQIEELLQYRLSQTPELAHRSIHIRPAIDGGIRIEVDGRTYEGIGDVDDDEIRAFLQETVRQWEARQ
ncbi:MAG: hypothetical protein WBH90_14810 [Aggregatilineales bacterium]|nr:hypothetical protein [Aggregatilineales bacterium]HQE20121.1 hypothetical protein [Aggregatilineales bacterium]